MKRLINSTTILSMALYIVPPFAAQAQDFPMVTIDGTEVICLPDKKAECPEGAFCIVVKNDKNCEVRATEALAALAAEAAAADEAATAGVAADQAAADKAAAEAAAAEQAAANQAAVDAAAADKAAADKAAADASAAEKAAADQAAADAAAAEQAAKDQAAADAAAADKEARKAARKAEAEAAKAAEAAAAATAAAAAEAEAAEAAATSTEAPAEPAPAATADATTEAPAAEPAPVEAALPSVVVEGLTFICLPDKEAVCPEGAECVLGKTIKKCEERAAAKVADMAAGDAATAPEATPDATVVTEAPAEDAAAVAAAQAAAEAAAAAAAADPNVTIVDVPEPTEEAVDTLETALDTPVASGDVVTEPVVEAATGEVVTSDGTLPSDVEPSTEATVTTEVVTEDDTRDSTEEFAAAPVTVAPGKKTGLSDFEKVGLLALGALAIGAMINGNKQVVSNTGDRVVVRQPDGSYQVYKDDNALLREPGSTVRTETYRDGSTRTVVQRVDGSQIVTIRDATGRVLQRVAYDRNGRGTVLIDDLQPEERVDVSTLPPPRGNQISVDDTDAALRAQLAAAQAEEVGRTFSLRQIRMIPEVRHLAPTIDVNNITFETGSSAIQATEARKLNKLGSLITQLIDANPNEVFLIEGHTDAVGSAASNLALSDRRAESVAKALTEYFDVPPENLVVQGYGEGELKIDTLGDERANRRVAVRIVTTLLRQGAN
jgi:outer membrane protein OmpA-like peptidoglycan-associated protein